MHSGDGSGERSGVCLGLGKSRVGKCIPSFRRSLSFSVLQVLPGTNPADGRRTKYGGPIGALDFPERGRNKLCWECRAPVASRLCGLGRSATTQVPTGG
jgi:hypothetical protein